MNPRPRLDTAGHTRSMLLVALAGALVSGCGVGLVDESSEEIPGDPPDAADGSAVSPPTHDASLSAGADASTAAGPDASTGAGSDAAIAAGADASTSADSDASTAAPDAAIAQDASTGPVTVALSPPSASLAPRAALTFVATVSNSSNTAVTWSVQEGSSGGEVTASGVYTAPASDGTFHVIATSVADPIARATATVSVTTPVTPPQGAPMTTAHRTTGVAPLAVFFDAVDDLARSGPSRTFAWTSGVHQPADYEGTLYVWDFGDPASGAWAHTGRSKNTATGYTAAHVYESPGTYSVSLTQTDPAGTVRTYTQTITVVPFSGSTFYVAESGSDSNSGATASAPLRSVAAAMRAAFATAGPVQVLFRRGDTFPVNTGWVIEKAGPGIIGAYADGTSGHTASDPRPIITAPDIGELHVFEPRAPDGDATSGVYAPGAGGQDWRFMELDIRSTATASASGAIGPPNAFQGAELLMLRVRTSDFRDSGLGWADWTTIHPYPHDRIFLVECESTAPGGDYGAFIGGRRLAVLGNDFHDIGRSHVLRVWMMHKGVISNNRLWNPGPTRHALKLHGPPMNQGQAETRFVTISDNLFRGKTWTATIGSQDTISAEQPAHVVFERNRFFAESSIQIDLLVHDSLDVMVRNNVFDGRGAASGYTGINVRNFGGVVPPGDRVRVLNNTITRLEASQDFSGVTVEGGIPNVIIRNNLSAPGGATEVGGDDGVNAAGAGTGLVLDHNLVTQATAFVDGAGGDFAPLAGSSPAAAGIALPEVREDHLRAARPQGSCAVGAYEPR